ncbi:PfkB family carbohydrate kinase [uncultured Pseudokineococcus sp.]|uniref:PfkB family carbohydrate kinase n=1 Tax=uncultured Pseudokineococcus sp. TaxID=1642928 RepID=UPI00260B1B4E|nr:PfkB family carbohydrate kinase [uncultured Pseudokineococcus sp.]
MSADARRPFDVVVLGEVLLEVSTDAPLGDGVPARLGISGDALNAAAAAAAAGARTGLVSVVADDEAGRAVRARVAELGVSTDLLVTGEGQQGLYLTHADPDGEREFTYVRRGSVGSTLGPEHLDAGVLAAAGAVLAGGITCAISASARAAVMAAAEAASRFVYDPNHRPRLRSSEEALADLLALAPRCALVTPSYPAETRLLGASTPQEAARDLRGRGARGVAVTCGARGVHVEADGLPDGGTWVDAVPAPHVVDQTGAGDSFVGTTAAHLALGADLPDAVLQGVAAASLVVGGRGGTGLVPSAEQVRAHLAARRAGR